MADKRLFAKAAFMVVSASLFTVGCGDDVTKTTVNETTGIAQLAKGEAFPECASENTGEMLFAADSGAVYYCADGKWQTLNGKDGEAGENGDVCEEEILSDSSGYKILCGGDSVGVVLNGENGNSGENGESCDASPLADGSGYKVVCAGDSIGVVLNGAKGDSGAPGANAENCTFSDDGNGSVTVTCGTESVTLYKAICGTEPYDPGEKFCSNDGSKNEIVALCNGVAYDLSREFCYDNGTTEAVVALCNGAAYDLSREFCYDNGTTEVVIDRCDGAAYDLSTHFCGKKGTKDTVVALCNGATYNLSTEFCYVNSTTEEVVDRCDGAAYDLSTHFCGKKGTTEVVVELCNGAAYDFSAKFCYDNGTTEVVVNRCNGAAYDLSTHFCGNTGTKDTVVALCDGAAYDLSTHFCGNIGTKDTVVALCNGNTFDIATEFCADDKIYVISEYSFVTTEYLNQTMLKNGNYGYLADSRDNQAYRTIQIGTQTWMAQNLNYETTDSYCYVNDETNCEKYGRLYTWDAARTVCPTGWHLPDTTELRILINAVGGEESAATKLMSTSGWELDGNGTDDFGYSALPAGSREGYGSFSNVGYDAEFCSVTEDGAAYAYAMIVRLDVYEGGSKAGLRSGVNKNGSHSVRCLRDSGL